MTEKQKKGFAAMDPAKQKAIASKGGKAAHQKGTAHEWTSSAAREAGRKGALAGHDKRAKAAAAKPESPPFLAPVGEGVDRG